MVLEAHHAAAFLLFEVDQQLGWRQAHAAVFDRPRRRDPALGGQAKIPVLVLGPAQPPRREALGKRVVGFEVVADQRPECVVGERVPVLGLRDAVTEFGRGGHQRVLVESGELIAPQRRRCSAPLPIQADSVSARLTYSPRSYSSVNPIAPCS